MATRVLLHHLGHRGVHRVGPPAESATARSAIHGEAIYQGARLAAISAATTTTTAETVTTRRRSTDGAASGVRSLAIARAPHA